MKRQILVATSSRPAVPAGKFTPPVTESATFRIFGSVFCRCAISAITASVRPTSSYGSERRLIIALDPLQQGRKKLFFLFSHVPALSLRERLGRLVGAH